MSTILFVSDAAKYRIFYNVNDTPLILDGTKYVVGEPVISSSPFKCHDLKRGVPSEKGYFQLDSGKDKERIDYIRNYPEYRKMYVEREKLPIETFLNGSIVAGVQKKGEDSVDTKKHERAGFEKGMRYMELKQKYFKLDGERKANVNEEDAEVAAELLEFENLKKELSL